MQSIKKNYQKKQFLLVNLDKQYNLNEKIATPNQ